MKSAWMGGYQPSLRDFRLSTRNPAINRSHPSKPKSGSLGPVAGLRSYGSPGQFRCEQLVRFMVGIGIPRLHSPIPRAGIGCFARNDKT